MHRDVEQSGVERIEDRRPSGDRRHASVAKIEQREVSRRTVADDRASVRQKGQAEWHLQTSGNHLHGISAELAVVFPALPDGIGGNDQLR